MLTLLRRLPPRALVVVGLLFTGLFVHALAQGLVARAFGVVGVGSLVLAGLAVAGRRRPR